MIDSSTENSSREGEAAVAAGQPRGLIPVPEFDENRLQYQFNAAPELTAGPVAATCEARCSQGSAA